MVLLVVFFFHHEACGTTRGLAEQDGTSRLGSLEYFRRCAANSEEREVIVISHLEMFVQSLYGFGNKACVIDTDRDSYRRGLDERDLEAIAMNNIENLAQALLQNKGEVFCPHRNKNLVLAPDIHRDINGSNCFRGDT